MKSGIIQKDQQNFYIETVSENSSVNIITEKQFMSNYGENL